MLTALPYRPLSLMSAERAEVKPALVERTMKSTDVAVRLQCTMHRVSLMLATDASLAENRASVLMVCTCASGSAAPPPDSFFTKSLICDDDDTANFCSCLYCCHRGANSLTVCEKGCRSSESAKATDPERAREDCRAEDGEAEMPMAKVWLLVAKDASRKVSQQRMVAVCPARSDEMSTELFLVVGVGSPSNMYTTPAGTSKVTVRPSTDEEPTLLMKVARHTFSAAKALKYDS